MGSAPGIDEGAVSTVKMDGSGWSKLTALTAAVEGVGWEHNGVRLVRLAIAHEHTATPSRSCAERQHGPAELGEVVQQHGQRSPLQQKASRQADRNKQTDALGRHLERSCLWGAASAAMPSKTNPQAHLLPFYVAHQGRTWPGRT